MDCPATGWLGRYSSREHIRTFGLWATVGVTRNYQPYVEQTWDMAGTDDQGRPIADWLWLCATCPPADNNCRMISGRDCGLPVKAIIRPLHGRSVRRRGFRGRVRGRSCTACRTTADTPPHATPTPRASRCPRYARIREKAREVGEVFQTCQFARRSTIRLPDKVFMDMEDAVNRRIGQQLLQTGIVEFVRRHIEFQGRTCCL